MNRIIDHSLRYLEEFDIGSSQTRNRHRILNCIEAQLPVVLFDMRWLLLSAQGAPELTPTTGSTPTPVPKVMVLVERRSVNVEL